MPGGSWRSGELSYTARTGGGSDPGQQYPIATEAPARM